MKNRNYLVVLMAIIMVTGVSCSSTNDSNRQQGQGQMEGEDPLDMDIDGDSLISRDEASGLILETFDEIDSDGDGFLSLAELKSYKDSNQGQPGGR